MTWSNFDRRGDGNGRSKKSAYYRQIVESAEQGIWLVDSHAKGLFVNAKLAEMLGYAADEMLGKEIYSFMEPEHQANARAFLERRRKGIREIRDFAFRKKDGGKIWARVTASPLFDENGDFAGAVGIVDDVSERRKTELLLSAQRNIFELLVRGEPLSAALDALIYAIESLVDGVIASVLLLDDDGKRLWTGSAPHLPQACNRAIHGASIGPRAGSCGTSAYYKKLVIVSDTYTDPLWEDYKSFAESFGLRACWSSPIFSRDGRVLGTFAMYFREVRKPSDVELQFVKDATSAAALSIEYVKTKESLAAAVSLMNSAIESTADGIIIVSVDGVIQSCNQKFVQMWKIPRDILDSRSHTRFVRFASEQLKDPKSYLERIDEMNASPESESFDTIEFKNGTVLERYSIPQRLGNKVVGRVGSYRDVTKRREDERERDRLISLEKQAREDATVLYQEAQKSIAVRDDFISIASHELRTPLTPLKMQVQLSRKYVQTHFHEAEATALNELLSDSEKQVERMAKLVENLLDVSRIRAGRFILSLEEVDLSELVSLVVRVLSSQLESAKCRVTLSAEPGVKGCWDKSRLEQVIANLLVNAMKFGSGRPIEISVSKEARTAIVSITDHGMGISAGNHEKIFGRFERVASWRSFGGLGLGLYISRQIVEDHGGSITVASELGKGSTFLVRLPIRSS